MLLRKTSRGIPHSDLFQDDIDDEIDGKRSYELEEKLELTFVAAEKSFRVAHLNGKEVNYEHFQRKGFTVPIFVTQPNGLGIRLPEKLTVDEVLKLVGGDVEVEVINSLTQSSDLWTLERWVKYYNKPVNKRDKTLNVISLEITGTKLDSLISSPRVVKKLDWVHLVWPLPYRYVDVSKIKRPEEMTFPKVLKYCLMSVAGCYTDFHIDLGGTSVWYHIIKGQKTFWIIPPTDDNLREYEQWTKSTQQDDIFLAEKCTNCQKIALTEGNTFFIPTGWIHAVYTPVDSLVVGGNFLHSFNIGLQLRASAIEESLRIGSKYRYPYFSDIMWYVYDRYCTALLGRSFISIDNKSSVEYSIIPESPVLTKYELQGLKHLREWLMNQPDQSWPNELTNHKALITSMMAALARHAGDDKKVPSYGTPLLQWKHSTLKSYEDKYKKYCMNWSKDTTKRSRESSNDDWEDEIIDQTYYSTVDNLLKSQSINKIKYGGITVYRASDGTIRMGGTKDKIANDKNGDVRKDRNIPQKPNSDSSQTSQKKIPTSAERKYPNGRRNGDLSNKKQEIITYTPIPKRKHETEADPPNEKRKSEVKSEKPTEKNIQVAEANTLTQTRRHGKKSNTLNRKKESDHRTDPFTKKGEQVDEVDLRQTTCRQEEIEDSSNSKQKRTVKTDKLTGKIEQKVKVDTARRTRSQGEKRDTTDHSSKFKVKIETSTHKKNRTVEIDASRKLRKQGGKGERCNQKEDQEVEADTPSLKRKQEIETDATSPKRRQELKGDVPSQQKLDPRKNFLEDKKRNENEKLTVRKSDRDRSPAKHKSRTKPLSNKTESKHQTSLSSPLKKQERNFQKNFASGETHSINDSPKKGKSEKQTEVQIKHTKPSKMVDLRKDPVWSHKERSGEAETAVTRSVSTEKSKLGEAENENSQSPNASHKQEITDSEENSGVNPKDITSDKPKQSEPKDKNNNKKLSPSKCPPDVPSPNIILSKFYLRTMCPDLRNNEPVNFVKTVPDTADIPAPAVAIEGPVLEPHPLTIPGETTTINPATEVNSTLKFFMTTALSSEKNLFIQKQDKHSSVFYKAVTTGEVQPPKTIISVESVKVAVMERNIAIKPSLNSLEKPTTAVPVSSTAPQGNKTQSTTIWKPTPLNVVQEVSQKAAPKAIYSSNTGVRSALSEDQPAAMMKSPLKSTAKQTPSTSVDSTCLQADQSRSTTPSNSIAVKVSKAKNNLDSNKFANNTVTSAKLVDPERNPLKTAPVIVPKEAAKNNKLILQIGGPQKTSSLERHNPVKVNMLTGKTNLVEQNFKYKQINRQLPGKKEPENEYYIITDKEETRHFEVAATRANKAEPVISNNQQSTSNTSKLNNIGVTRLADSKTNTSSTQQQNAAQSSSSTSNISNSDSTKKVTKEVTCKNTVDGLIATIKKSTADKNDTRKMVYLCLQQTMTETFEMCFEGVVLLIQTSHHLYQASTHVNEKVLIQGTHDSVQVPLTYPRKDDLKSYGNIPQIKAKRCPKVHLQQFTENEMVVDSDEELFMPESPFKNTKSIHGVLHKPSAQKAGCRPTVPKSVTVYKKAGKDSIVISNARSLNQKSRQATATDGLTLLDDNNTHTIKDTKFISILKTNTNVTATVPVVTSKGDVNVTTKVVNRRSVLPRSYPKWDEEETDSMDDEDYLMEEPYDLEIEGFQYDPDDDEYTKAYESPNSSSNSHRRRKSNNKFPYQKTYKRRPRCRVCDGCIREDCGKCAMCLDKPKFGGKGRCKQACLLKKCEALGGPQSAPKSAAASKSSKASSKSPVTVKTAKSNSADPAGSFTLDISFGPPTDNLPRVVLDRDDDILQIAKEAAALPSESGDSDAVSEPDPPEKSVVKSSVYLKMKEIKQRSRNIPNCGECASCRDMRQFGGPGKRRQMCLQRKSYINEKSAALGLTDLNESIKLEKTDLSEDEDLPTKRRRKPTQRFQEYKEEEYTEQLMKKAHEFVVKPDMLEHVDALLDSYDSDSTNSNPPIKKIKLGENEQMRSETIEIFQPVNHQSTQNITMEVLVITPEEECLPHVFKYLSKTDLFSCSLVCKMWNRASHDPSLWSQIDLSKKVISSTVAQHVANLQPQTLILNMSIIDTEALEILLGQLSQCQSLSLRGVDTVCKLNLSLIPHTVLNLNISNIQEFYDKTFSTLFTVTVNTHRLLETVVLDLSQTDVSDCSVKLLNNCMPCLEQLTMNYCHTITDKSIEHLTDNQQPCLRILSMYGCNGLTGECLNQFQNTEMGGFQMLESVDFEGCDLVTHNDIKKFLISAPDWQACRKTLTKKVIPSSLNRVFTI